MKRHPFVPAYPVTEVVSGHHHIGDQEHKWETASVKRKKIKQKTDEMQPLGQQQTWLQTHIPSELQLFLRLLCLMGVVPGSSQQLLLTYQPGKLTEAPGHMDRQHSIVSLLQGDVAEVVGEAAQPLGHAGVAQVEQHVQAQRLEGIQPLLTPDHEEIQEEQEEKCQCIDYLSTLASHSKTGGSKKHMKFKEKLPNRKIERTVWITAFGTKQLWITFGTKRSVPRTSADHNTAVKQAQE
ncbi:hypothetical protein DV515_00009947 [Chloebia gouldiae]|uniref:Uncharacterized protein n=1 Tax=Chloebia gouldiae TaxID=44316 RepID=A0A3L8SBF2_CHLGU|nr:hypothetical protein DV515_00009947 [Chloebia gouldiae]